MISDIELWTVEDRPGGIQVATMYFVDDRGFPYPTGDTFTGPAEFTELWLRFRALQPLEKCDCTHCAPLYATIQGRVWANIGLPRIDA